MSIALILALLAPLLGAVAIAFTRQTPNARETVTLLTAGLTFLIVLGILPQVLDGARPSAQLVELLPGLSLAFEVEPLGMLFALVASGLWILNSIYSIGYMRSNEEHNQTRFYVCFAISIASAIGIAFAANMFTLFIFYECLTLATWPLVTHHGDEKSRRGGRTYLGLLLGTSICLLLPGMIWTWAITGTLTFTAGGIFPEDTAPATLGIILMLFMFGTGKAALMPFHRWLPAAMVAPTPVSALLHAVAVVKAGVFTVLKVMVYIFGIDLLHETGSANWLVWMACITFTLASIIALGKDNLKARLAYSTIGQLSYVVAGAALAISTGIIGGGLQIVMHAMGKITLFFCAGAIYTAAHKTEISDMHGLGRRMPITYCAFLIGSLSIIALPPFGGTWSKWYLVLAALEREQLIMVVALAVSSLLNIAYLMPVVFQGFFRSANTADGFQAGVEASGIKRSAIHEAPLLCLIPLSLTAVGCVVLFFFGDSVVSLLTPAVAGP